MRPVDSVKPYENNPRNNEAAIDPVAKSIEQFGFRQPIVVDSDGVIIVGHTRHAAAIKLGLEEVPVHVAEGMSDDEVKAYRIADNKVGELAEWNEEWLKTEMQALPDVEWSDLGFSGEELLGLSGLEEGDGSGLTGEDDIPELPPDPITKPGDLWLLGDHRLLCGSCRSSEDVAVLLDSVKFNMCVTSPPYAAQREYDTDTEFKPVPPEDYVDWFDEVQSLISSNMAEDGSFFLNIKEHCQDGRRVMYVKHLTIHMVESWGWWLVDELVWTHGGTPRAVRRRFKNGWEPIFHFAKANHKFRPDNVKHRSDNVPDWGGGHPCDEGHQGKNFAATHPDRSKQKGSNSDNQGTGQRGGSLGDAVDYVASLGWAYPSNVLSLGKNREALGHSAAYPVGLPEFFIKAYSDEGDIVYEPFAGSGTTLIASDKLNRRCMAMELSPQYCDVIVKRWEDCTGKKAVRQQDAAAV